MKLNLKTLRIALILPILWSAPGLASAQRPLPESFKNAEFKMLGGKSFRFADQENKVIIVMLIASWCGAPCQLAVPKLNELKRQYSKRGLVVIGLTTNEEDTEAKLLQFIPNANFELGWIGPEVADDLMPKTTSPGQFPITRNGAPQFLIISRDGLISTHVVGYDYKKTPSEIRKRIQALLR